MRGAWVLVCFVVGCKTQPADLEPVHRGPTVEVAPDASAQGGGDGGVAGGSSDGGADGGAPGAGPYDAGTLVLPSPQGWQFFGPQHGGPRRAHGVSSDEAGNLWVAGGEDGLFLLTPGATAFRRFTHVDGLAQYTDAAGVHGFPVLSVAGGPGSSAFVGYKGLHGGADDFDPPYMLTSGDADKVVWDGAGLSVTHFDLSTPPGEDPHYPMGRDKIRDVFRIVYDARTQDVWFGGNHGIAMFHATAGKVFEHQHCAINGYTASGSYTLLSGDFYGLALDGAGDVWMGGGHRVARLKFASEGRQFWASLDPTVDVWPDAQAVDPRPHERTDDFVQDLAVTSDGAVWVGSIPNGLARVTPAGVSDATGGLLDRKVTALEVDPLDQSVWVGHIWGGLSRLTAQGVMHYDVRVFGIPVVSGDVPDIQSDRVNGQRRILVAFGSGAVGIYTGP